MEERSFIDTIVKGGLLNPLPRWERAGVRGETTATNVAAPIAARHAAPQPSGTLPNPSHQGRGFLNHLPVDKAFSNVTPEKAGVQKYLKTGFRPPPE